MVARVLAIRDAVAAALDAISLADGWAHDLAGSVRKGFIAAEIAERPVAFVGIRGETDDDEVVVDGIDCTLRMEIAALVDPPYPDPAGIEQHQANADAYVTLVRDMKAAILGQRARDPMLGIPGVVKLAIRAWDVLPRDGDVVLDGVAVLLDVVFRHDVDDPDAYAGTVVT